MGHRVVLELRWRGRQVDAELFRRSLRAHSGTGWLSSILTHAPNGSTAPTIILMLRLTFATGTEPGKWFDRFRTNTAHGGLDTTDADDPIAVLLAGEADLVLARLSKDSPDPRIDDGFFIVQLYDEARGIAVPKDSVYHQVGGDLTPDDVAEETVNYRISDNGVVDVPAVRAGLQVVAANVGVVIAPRPLLKVLAKKQVIPLGFDDPTVPQTSIALVWRKEADSDAIQDFVGVAKGRTAQSSRQQRPKLSAREKALAKQQRRETVRAGGRADGRAGGREGKQAGGRADGRVGGGAGKAEKKVSKTLRKPRKASGQVKRRKMR